MCSDPVVIKQIVKEFLKQQDEKNRRWKKWELWLLIGSVLVSVLQLVVSLIALYKK